MMLKLEKEMNKRILNPRSMWTDLVRRYQRWEYKLQDIWDEYLNPQYFNRFAFDACRRIKGSARVYEDSGNEEEEHFAIRGEKSLKESFYQYLTQKKKIRKLDNDGEILDSQDYGDDEENLESELNPED